MIKEQHYSTQLGAGMGVIEESRVLLEVWNPGVDTSQLFQQALKLGSFPNMSARRLRNLISECFAPRFMGEGGYPAIILKQLIPYLSSKEFSQLLYIFTCRANIILADFVRDIYWTCYSSGREKISNEDARNWVTSAIEQGKTVKPWSENLIERVAGYLTKCCADFGMLESGQRRERRIVPFRIEPIAALFLAYDLHFEGLGDNSIISHNDWALFGLEPRDVVDILKQLSLRGFFIVQTAGDVTRISWRFKGWEELIHAISQG